MNTIVCVHNEVVQRVAFLKPLVLSLKPLVLSLKPLVLCMEHLVLSLETLGIRLKLLHRLGGLVFEGFSMFDVCMESRDRESMTGHYEFLRASNAKRTLTWNGGGDVLNYFFQNVRGPPFLVHDGLVSSFYKYYKSETPWRAIKSL